MPLTANLRGALFMAVSMAGFTLNDAITKGLLETFGQGQVMLMRGLFATMMIGCLAWNRGALDRPRQVLHRMVGLRSACEFLSTVTFLIALAHMPLANVSAIMQALPLAITMGAALFLGETVGWRRWLAICAGFVGVLIVVRPGFEGFSVYSILTLVCVLFCAVRDLSTRYVPSETPSMLISVVTSTVVTIGGALLIPFSGGWKPLALADIGLLATSAALLLVGYQFIIMAMRIGDISYVAPFRYTGLIWSVLLGFLLFGDIPDTAMIVGAAIIVASGIYTLYRERTVGETQPAAESINPGMAADGL